MRTFLRKLAILALLQLGVWALVFWSYARQRPFNLEFGAVINDKKRLLAEQPSPRIILVGGSNLMFGIDSAEIERETGYHPVNMGLNVGDGLDFMLNNVTPWLKTGDVVVISPEYENFGDLFDGQGDFLYTEVEHRPSIISSFTARNYLELLNKGHIIAGNILRYTLEGRGYTIREAIKNAGHPYRRDAFNQYGDIDRRLHKTTLRSDSYAIVVPLDVQFISTKVTRVINRLNEFGEECRRRGVQVFYSFPPIPPGMLEKLGPEIRAIAAELQRRLQFKLLDTPEEEIFPLEEFYDSVYHLTTDGSEKRTRQLVRKLLEQGVGLEKSFQF